MYCYSFIRPMIKYLLSTCCVPGLLQRARDSLCGEQDRTDLLAILLRLDVSYSLQLWSEVYSTRKMS